MAAFCLASPLLRSCTLFFCCNTTVIVFSGAISGDSEAEEAVLAPYVQLDCAFSAVPLGLLKNH